MISNNNQKKNFSNKFKFSDSSDSDNNKKSNIQTNKKNQLFPQKMLDEINTFITNYKNNNLTIEQKNKFSYSIDTDNNLFIFPRKGNYFNGIKGIDSRIKPCYCIKNYLTDKPNIEYFIEKKPNKANIFKKVNIDKIKLDYKKYNLSQVIVTNENNIKKERYIEKYKGETLSKFFENNNLPDEEIKKIIQTAFEVYKKLFMSLLPKNETIFDAHLENILILKNSKGDYTIEIIDYHSRNNGGTATPFTSKYMLGTFKDIKPSQENSSNWYQFSLSYFVSELNYTLPLRMSLSLSLQIKEILKCKDASTLTAEELVQMIADINKLNLNFVNKKSQIEHYESEYEN